MKCCIDYYHKTNIEDTEKDLGDFFYFPKVIKPVKISIEYTEEELNDENSIFLKSQDNDHFLIIDKSTKQIFDKEQKEIFRSSFPLQIGKNGLLISLVIRWGGRVTRLSKEDFLCSIKKLNNLQKF